MTSTNDEEMLFEVMTIEGILGCIFSLITTHLNDLLRYHSKDMILIYEALESIFKTIKVKYQPKFRSNYRFRILHVMLLEVYTCLLPNSLLVDNLNTIYQQVFVEALRVFRDSISSYNLCTCMHDYLEDTKDEYGYEHLLNISISTFYSFIHFNQIETCNENEFILRLERNTTILQKKESETSLSNSMKHKSCIPSSIIDSRTVDASILLIAKTFNNQSIEYQMKAIQLFSQAISQSIKGITSLMNSSTTTSSSSMFSSSSSSNVSIVIEEKKELKNYITLKNVSVVLGYVIQSLPCHINIHDNNKAMDGSGENGWIIQLIDRLFELMGYWFSNDIRCAATSSLAIFLLKLKKSSLVFTNMLLDSLYSKIHPLLMNKLDKMKSNQNETLFDMSSYLLILGNLWSISDSSEMQQSNKNSIRKLSLQDRILSTILTCLRRLDTCVSFRAHGIIAMKSIVKEIQHQIVESNGVLLDNDFYIKSIIPILTNISTTADLHSSSSCVITSVMINEDIDTLHVHILSLITSMMTLCLEIYYSFNHPMVEIKDLMDTCFRLWYTHYLSNHYDLPNKLVMRECAKFLSTNLPHMKLFAEINCQDVKMKVHQDYIMYVLRDIIEEREYMDFHALEFAIDAISTISRYPRVLIQVMLYILIAIQ